MSNINQNYPKFHRIVGLGENIESYTNIGWKVISIQKVSLRGIDKEYYEYHIKWDIDDSPIEPT